MRPSRSAAAFQLVGVGFYIATCIVVGIAGGLALDGWLHTSPAFLLVGLFLGLAVAFYGTYRMVSAVFASDSGQDGEDS